MLARWSEKVLKARLIVVFVWVALSAFGFYGANNLDKYLTTSLEVPGSDSAIANQLLDQHFKENTEGTFTVMYAFEQATKQEIADFNIRILKASSVIPNSEIIQSKAFAGTLYANIGTSFELKQAAEYTKALRAALLVQGLSGALVTGPPAIKSDVAPILSSDLHRGQVIAIFLALLLLMATLGFSWAVLIPLIFGISTIATSLGIIYLLAHKFLMVLYIPNIVELIGLGLAIDYSLIMLHRYRKEQERSENPIGITMETAGRTVVISGLTVAIGLATLLLVPVPFIRSIGLACLVLPLVSIAAAITLQPVLLTTFGSSRNVKFGGLLALSFKPLVNLVIEKPGRVMAGSITFLAIAASALLWLQITPSSLTAIPDHLESAQALKIVTDKVGPGIITPHEILFDLGTNAGDPNMSVIRFELAKKIADSPEVFTVAAGDKWPYVDTSGRFMRMYIFGQHDLGAPETAELVNQIRQKYIPRSGFPDDVKIYLGGAPAQGVDLLKTITSTLPLIIFLILITTFLLLMRSFSSLLLALKAILLDLISTAVAIAAVVIVFKFGIGTYHLDQIEAWALILLFAVLFGLSMDYEVFLVSRMREAWDRGLSNKAAIREGMESSGAVVTAAALIFVAALSGMIFGHFAGLQQLGIGLAAGVLIDATVIRALLLPSAMVLLGKWNWWSPHSLASLVHGKASPLEKRVTRL